MGARGSPPFTTKLSAFEAEKTLMIVFMHMYMYSVFMAPQRNIVFPAFGRPTSAVDRDRDSISKYLDRSREALIHTSVFTAGYSPILSRNQERVKYSQIYQADDDPRCNPFSASNSSGP